LGRLQLQTTIHAPADLCFDLSRSIEVHLASSAHTKETVVAGKSSGLCEVGDVITWCARHFGVFQRLTVRITRVEYPTYFRDEMLSGAFKGFVHHHYFTEVAGTTIMKDEFCYTTPLGVLGKCAEFLFLDNYMQQLLVTRNAFIKNAAETGTWKLYLKC